MSNRSASAPSEAAVTSAVPAAASFPPAAPVPISIRILRRLRPVVVGLLGSPLHGLLSRDVLLLTYRGRRSGRPYTLPLSYVAAAGGLYLCTRPEGSRWWKNLLGGPDVQLRHRGREVAARAVVLESGCVEARRALEAFVARNPRTGELLYQVRRGAGGRPNAADLDREVGGSVVVRLEVGGVGGVWRRQ